MKNQKTLLFCAVLCVAALSACFSPWSGSDKDANLNYTVTLTNSEGRSIEVEPTSVNPIVISVPQGKWKAEVTVNAVKDDDFAATKQRFLGEADINVSDNKENITLSVSINEMTPAIQVKTWGQFSNAFSKWGKYLNEIGWKPSDKNKDCYIEIIDDTLQVNETATLDENDKNIVLWTKKDVTIKRGTGGSLFKIDKGTLTLGRKGQETLSQGDITIEGNNNTDNNSLIMVSGGELIMNKGVTITGNTTSSHGGGVHVNGGTFTMNGGEISHNTSRPTSYTGDAGGGGGVYVINGDFIMKGGSIHDNDTEGHGGGVRVFTADPKNGFKEEGRFVMEGGEIYDNKSYGFGGGVRVRGTFTMKGGEIYGNTVRKKNDSNNPGYGGGVGIADTNADEQYTSGKFFMEGGIIRNNTAEGNGGGVFKGPVGKFTQTGGTISDNDPNETYLQ